MTANTVNGSGNGARSGAQPLVLLAAPLIDFTLRALSEGPRRHAELQRESGFPAQTTLRAQLKHLVEIGAVSKSRRDRFPGALEYELTASGRDLFHVARILEHWLNQAPDGPLPVGGSAAKAAIKALTDGWSTTMLRALVAGPLSLTELDRIISPFSYPSLERRLAAMRRVGLVVACAGHGRSTPYAVTDWARKAVVPLAAAANWEQRHLANGVAPIAAIDVEAAFLLAVPLMRDADWAEGSCRLAVELANGQQRRLAGVTVVFKDGKIASCATNLRGNADAWALGPPAAWLNALIENEMDRLEVRGDRQLALSLVERLRSTQFDVPI